MCAISSLTSTFAISSPDEFLSNALKILAFSFIHSCRSLKIIDFDAVLVSYVFWGRIPLSPANLVLLANLLNIKGQIFKGTNMALAAPAS